GTIRTTNIARTGSACLGVNGAGDNITSPLVSNPANLSFWYRRSSNSATWGSQTEELNSSKTLGATLAEIKSSTTTYQEYTADLSQYNNIKIRLTDTRGSGTHERYVDDFKITVNLTPSYSLTYTAGANGTIDGTSPQTVQEGADGTAVTAVPNEGYHFVSWSDDSTDNPRTDSDVQEDISVTANFAINTYTVTYDGNGS